MNSDIITSCISFNLLQNSEVKEYPYNRGTGFFIKTVKNIYYITAKHCLLNSCDNQNIEIDKLMIPLNINSSSDKEEFTVFFSEYIMEEETDGYCAEDFIVFVVDKEKNKEDYDVIKERAFGVIIDMDINILIDYLTKNKQIVYVKGFPQTEKNIDYDNQELRASICEFSAKIVDNPIINHYELENMNWKGKFEGFSGSPVFAFINFFNTKPILIILGILINGTKEKCRFLSIDPIFKLIQKLES